MSALDRFAERNGVLYIHEDGRLRKPTVEEELLRDMLLELQRMAVTVANIAKC